jgi:hypothetical protein
MNTSSGTSVDAAIAFISETDNSRANTTRANPSFSATLIVSALVKLICVDA